MTDKNTDSAGTRSSGRPDHRPTKQQAARISGDPGVGGLLADPEEAVSKPTHPPKTDPGPPTPDPELPRAHGDWAPNRTWRGQTDTETKAGGKISVRQPVAGLRPEQQ
jgi:hypothetical protein